MRLLYWVMLCAVCSACQVSFIHQETGTFERVPPTPSRELPTIALERRARTPWPTQPAIATQSARDSNMATVMAIETHTMQIYAQSVAAVVAIEAPFRHPPVDGVDVPTDMFVSQGSGFVYDDQGHIVTNAHVVSDANVYRIRLDEQRVVSATVIGRNTDHDIAVLALDEYVALAPLSLSQRRVQPGMWVMAIGNPFGLRDSVSVGIVSGIARELTNEYGMMRNIIQIDASVNPGSSGGVLLDSSGAVIGLVTAIQSGNGNFAGIGYAIPVETIQSVVPALITPP